MTRTSPTPESPTGRRAAIAAVALAAGLACVAPTAGAAVADAPPGRGYERVSPQTTNDDGVRDYTAQYFRAFGDDKVIFGGGVAPSPPGAGSPGGLSSLGMARRTSTGWVTTSLLPPSAPSAAAFFPEGADVTGDTVVVSRKNSQFNPSLTLTVSQQLIRRGPDGSFSVLVDIGDPQRAQPGELEALGYGGLSADGRTVVYNATRPPAELDGAPGVPEARRFQAYRWREGQPQQALGVDATGEPLNACGVSVAGPLVDNNTGADATSYGTNALSSDGATTFLQVPSETSVKFGGPCDGQASQLFVDTDDGAVEISTPRAGTAPRTATFFGAAPDGRRAYFATRSAIAPGDPDDGSNDLYRWDAPTSGSTGTRTCITCGVASPLSTDGKQVTVSPDGSHVYFAVGGSLWVSDGVRTQLAAARTATFTPQTSYGSGLATSYDGRTFVVRNTKNIPTDPIGSQRSGGALFRGVVGDAGVDLACITCAGPGATDPRPAYLPENTGFGGISPPGSVDRGVIPISDDGRTIAFTSPSTLSSPDTDFGPNTPGGAYVWEDGNINTVAAISPRPLQSQTFGTTPSGDSVFALTPRRLTADEVDDGDAIYVSRRGGGFAPPAAPPAPCAGEACRPAAPGPAGPAAPGSTAPAGVGNASPAAVPPKPSVVVRTPNASARRALAAGRSASVSVRLATKGTVRLRATARIARRTRTVASASKTLRAGTSSVKLKLNAAGRRELRRAGRLRVTLTTTQTGAPTRRVTFTIVRKAR